MLAVDIAASNGRNMGESLRFKPLIHLIERCTFSWSLAQETSLAPTWPEAVGLDSLSYLSPRDTAQASCFPFSSL